MRGKQDAVVSDASLDLKVYQLAPTDASWYSLQIDQELLESLRRGDGKSHFCPSCGMTEAELFGVKKLAA